MPLIFGSKDGAYNVYMKVANRRCMYFSLLFPPSFLVWWLSEIIVTERIKAPFFVHRFKLVILAEEPSENISYTRTITKWPPLMIIMSVNVCFYIVVII